MSFQAEIDKKIKDGSIYFVGDALPPDWYASFRIWSGLAEAGDMKAQLNTGWCHLYGEGVEANRQQSKAWLEKAAAQNCPKAHWYLSRDYFGADEATRSAHLERALALGDRLAVQHHSELQKKADEDRRKAAQQKAGEVFQGLLKEILQALAEDDHARAKSLLDAAVAQGHNVLSGVRGAFDVSLDNVTVSKRSQKGSLISGGVVNGTTQTYQEWNQFLDVSYTVTNAGPHPATLALRALSEGAQGDGNVHQSLGTIPPGESKTISVTITPQKTCALLPFTLVYAAGHNFKIPVSGFRRTIFPACESKLKNAGCFVLTACYRDANHPTVVSFRDFRDTHLTDHPLGRAFINFYYAHGPKAAAFVQDKPLLKKLLRAAFATLRLALPNR